MGDRKVKISLYDNTKTKDEILTGHGLILDNICVSCVVEENLENSEYFLDAEFIIDKEGLFNYIEEDAVLKVQLDYGKELFSIANVRKTTSRIVVFARQITITETLGMWLPDVRPTDMNGINALNHMQDNSIGFHNLEFSSDIITPNTAYYINKTMYEALHTADNSFFNRWGGEIQRRRYRMTINKKLGENKGVQIRSRKNLTGFEANTNIDNVVTRLKPVGYDGITIDGYVDSELINNYKYIRAKRIEYSNVKLKSEENTETEANSSDIICDTLEEAQNKLTELALLEYANNRIDELSADYTVNFVDLSKTEEYKDYAKIEYINLGDEIQVIEDTLNVNITVRAINRKYDVLAQKVIEIKLSNQAKLGKPASIESIKNRLDAVTENIGYMSVSYAKMKDLEATNAEIDNLKAIKADIGDLQVANGNITNLTSELGTIKTLVNGNLTSDNIHSLHITSSNTHIDDGIITNAMIDGLSASKIVNGTIDTNNVNIQSKDGGIVLTGSTQQFKDKEGHIRVQIGKDAQGNFTFCLFSQDGVGILLDETGIKAGAVPNGLIVNDMVAKNANISGEKIDIRSVVEEINGNTTMLNASSIQFDDTGQSLLVAFNTYKEKVDTINEITMSGDLSSIVEKVNKNSTQIGIMQGKIEQLISNSTEIKEDGTLVYTKSILNDTVKTVNSHATKIDSLEKNYNKVTGDLESSISKLATLEQDLGGFKTTVSETYTTKTEFDNLSIGGRNLAQKTSSDYSPSFSNFSGVENTVVSLGNVLTDGLAVGDTVTVRLVYKYVDIVPVDGQTATCKIQGSGDVTGWNSGEFNGSSRLQLSGSGEYIFNYNFIITENHLLNSYWKVRLRHDYVQSGSVAWKMFKVEKGNKATDWSPAPEDMATSDSVTSLTTRVQTAEQKLTKDGITNIVDNYYATPNYVNEEVSKIDQKADSITSTVSKIAKGGGNLLLNTRWEGAVPGESKCPEWIFQSGIHVYSKQGKTNYNKENTIYLGNSSSDSYYISQEMPVDKLPKNTNAVVSCDIAYENNVKGFSIGIDFFNGDTWVTGYTMFDESKCPTAENYICKITMPNSTYTRIVFYIKHKGSNNGTNAYLLMIGNLMFELGTEKTMWQPAPEDMATKSLVTQTANEVRYEFQQGGAFPNLVPNGAPTQTNDNNWWYWNATKYTGDTNYSELGFYSNKTSDNNCCLGSAWMVCSPSKTYSISFWAFCEPNVVNPYVAMKCTADYNTYKYTTITKLTKWDGSSSGTKWYKYKCNFTPPVGCTRMQICFHQENHTENQNYVTRIDQVMVIEGKDIFPSKWYPRFEEVESNTTTINKDGVNVRHNDGSRTNLNSSALNFYNSSNSLYAQVSNGVYKFWNGSNYIGYLGHAGWTADTSKRNISFAGEYGNTLTLSAKKTSSDTSYQTWLVVSGHEQTIAGVNYHQGVMLIVPRVSGIMHFYGLGSMGDTYPGKIYESSDGHLAVVGDSYVDIGIQVGDKQYNGIRVDEIDGNPYKVINMFGNLNMNGWKITNGAMASSLSATSAQTYALRSLSNEESYTDPTAKAITDIFPSQTPTEGEIRWTDRETHFTSEVENGVYECYIEIPWWIAQNLENNYHINITPRNGFYQYYISENDPYYFIVRSDKDSMGFTFEIVGKLLESNTTANNASVAGDQYLASDVKEPETADIITELDTTDIITTDTTSDI